MRKITCSLFGVALVAVGLWPVAMRASTERRPAELILGPVHVSRSLAADRAAPSAPRAAQDPVQEKKDEKLPAPTPAKKAADADTIRSATEGLTTNGLPIRVRLLSSNSFGSGYGGSARFSGGGCGGSHGYSGYSGRGRIFRR